MKQDKLEKFVTENRSYFDDLEPSKGIWENIESGESKKKFNPFLKSFMQVAAAVLLFVSAYFVFDLIRGNKEYYAEAAKQHKQIISSEKYQAKAPIKKEIEPVKMIADNSVKQVKKNQNNIHNVVEKSAIPESKELAEATAYYSEIIKTKKAEIFSCTTNNPDVKKEINNEFGQLDKAYKELQNDLKENMDNSQVVDAMIQNYRMKLEVLEYMKNHLCTAELK